MTTITVTSPIVTSIVTSTQLQQQVQQHLHQNSRQQQQQQLCYPYYYYYPPNHLIQQQQQHRQQLDNSFPIIVHGHQQQQHQQQLPQHSRALSMEDPSKMDQSSMMMMMMRNNDLTKNSLIQIMDLNNHQPQNLQLQNQMRTIILPSTVASTTAASLSTVIQPTITTRSSSNRSKQLQQQPKQRSEHRTTIPIRKQSVFVSPSILPTTTTTTTTTSKMSSASIPQSVNQSEPIHQLSTNIINHKLSNQDISEHITKLIQENKAILGDINNNNHNHQSINDVQQSSSSIKMATSFQQQNHKINNNNNNHNHQSKSIKNSSATITSTKYYQSRRNSAASDLKKYSRLQSALLGDSNNLNNNDNNNKSPNKKSMNNLDYVNHNQIPIQFLLHQHQQQPQQQQFHPSVYLTQLHLPTTTATVTNSPSLSAQSSSSSVPLIKQWITCATTTLSTISPSTTTWSQHYGSSSSSSSSSSPSSTSASSPLSNLYTISVPTFPTPIVPVHHKNNNGNKLTHSLFPSLYETTATMSQTQQHCQPLIINRHSIINAQNDDENMTKIIGLNGDEQLNFIDRKSLNINNIDNNNDNHLMDTKNCLVRNLLLNSTQNNNNNNNNDDNNTKNNLTNHLIINDKNNQITKNQMISKNNSNNVDNGIHLINNKINDHRSDVSDYHNNNQNNDEQKCIIKDLLLKSPSPSSNKKHNNVDNQINNKYRESAEKISTIPISTTPLSTVITNTLDSNLYLPPRKKSRCLSTTSSSLNNGQTEISLPQHQQQQSSTMLTPAMHKCRYCSLSFRQEQNLEIHQKYYCCGNQQLSNRGDNNQIESKESAGINQNQIPSSSTQTTPSTATITNPKNQQQAQRERKLCVLERPSIIINQSMMNSNLNFNNNGSGLKKDEEFLRPSASPSLTSVIPSSITTTTTTSKYNFGNILKTKLLSGFHTNHYNGDYDYADYDDDYEYDDDDNESINSSTSSSTSYRCPRHRKYLKKNEHFLLKKRKTSEPAFRHSNFNDYTQRETVINEHRDHVLKRQTQQTKLEVIPAYMPYLMSPSTKITLKGPILFPMLQNLLDNKTNYEFILDSNQNVNDSMEKNDEIEQKFIIKHEEELKIEQYIAKLVNDLIESLEFDEQINETMNDILDSLNDNKSMQSKPVTKIERPKTLALMNMENSNSDNDQKLSNRKLSVLINQCSIITNDNHNSNTINNIFNNDYIKRTKLLPSTLISPDTPRSKQKYQELFLDGNSYTNLGLKVTLRPTYCCIYRLQPMYVMQEANPQLSMYSQWSIQPVPDDHILKKLKSPSQLLSAYNSNEAVFYNNRYYCNSNNNHNNLTIPIINKTAMKTTVADQNITDFITDVMNVQYGENIDESNETSKEEQKIPSSTAVDCKNIEEFLKQIKLRLNLNPVDDQQQSTNRLNTDDNNDKNNVEKLKLTKRIFKTIIWSIDNEIVDRIYNTSTPSKLILINSTYYHLQQQQRNANHQLKHKSLNSQFQQNNKMIFNNFDNDNKQIIMFQNNGHRSNDDFIYIMSKMPTNCYVPNVQQIMSSITTNLASRKFSDCIGLKQKNNYLLINHTNSTTFNNNNTNFDDYFLNRGNHHHHRSSFSNNNSNNDQMPKRIKIFEGGFKSNEDYTYIRGRGRGKYVCGECGIRCKKPSMLKKHIRTHTDLRPYSCRHCSFAFKTKGNLTKHMKSKAHHKKCVELGINPVPTSIDDSQIDLEALAKQEQYELLNNSNNNSDNLSENQLNDKHISTTLNGENYDEFDDDNDYDDDEIDYDDDVDDNVNENDNEAAPIVKDDKQQQSIIVNDNKESLPIKPGQFDDAINDQTLINTNKNIINNYLDDDDKNQLKHPQQAEQKTISLSTVDNNEKQTNITNLNETPSKSLPIIDKHRKLSIIVNNNNNPYISNASNIITSSNNIISTTTTTRNMYQSEIIMNSPLMKLPVQHASPQPPPQSSILPPLLSSSPVIAHNENETEAIHSLLILSSGAAAAPEVNSRSNHQEHFSRQQQQQQNNHESIIQQTIIANNTNNLHNEIITTTTTLTTTTTTATTGMTITTASTTNSTSVLSSQSIFIPEIYGHSNKFSNPIVNYHVNNNINNCINPAIINDNGNNKSSKSSSISADQISTNKQTTTALPIQSSRESIIMNAQPTSVIITNHQSIDNNLKNNDLIINHRQPNNHNQSPNMTITYPDVNNKRIRTSSLTETIESSKWTEQNQHQTLKHQRTNSPTIVSSNKYTNENVQYLNHHNNRLLPKIFIDNQLEQHLRQPSSTKTPLTQTHFQQQLNPSSLTKSTLHYNNSPLLMVNGVDNSNISNYGDNRNKFVEPSTAALPMIVEQSLNRYVANNNSNTAKIVQDLPQQDEPIDLSSKKSTITHDNKQLHHLQQQHTNIVHSDKSSKAITQPSPTNTLMNHQSPTQSSLNSNNGIIASNVQQITEPYSSDNVVNNQQQQKLLLPNGHQLYRNLRNDEFSYLTPGMKSPHSLPRVVMMNNNNVNDNREITINSNNTHHQQQQQQSSSKIINNQITTNKSNSSSKSINNLDVDNNGKVTCPTCFKKFTKPEQLRLHFKIHSFERLFRCESCAVSFRTNGHLQKHRRSVSHMNKLSMNMTFGRPSSDNPRPFKCTDCKIAFRIHGHLAKHLRSKMHIMKLECLGRLPFGMYAEMERNNIHQSLIDTTDCNRALETLESLAQKLYDPRQMIWNKNVVINHNNHINNDDDELSNHSDTSNKSNSNSNVNTVIDDNNNNNNDSDSGSGTINEEYEDGDSSSSSSHQSPSTSLSSNQIIDNTDQSNKSSSLNPSTSPQPIQSTQSMPSASESSNAPINSTISASTTAIAATTTSTATTTAPSTLNSTISSIRSNTCHICFRLFKAAKFLQVHLYSEHFDEMNK